MRAKASLARAVRLAEQAVLVARRDQATSRLRGELESAVDDRWRTYSSLHWSSLMFASPRTSSREVAATNLVIPEADDKAIFAGARTAIQFALKLAKRKGTCLRVISMGSRMRGRGADEAAAALRTLAEGTPVTVSLHSGWALSDVTFGEEDLWIATHWTSAHALGVAADLRVIDPSSVVYLVQDYEPLFAAASTASALARATYHAGFELVVNSRPLAEYLGRHETLHVDRRKIFRPDLDLERLAIAAEGRTRRSLPRIGFYGRPSKPRNAFQLGVASVRAADRALTSARGAAEFVSVGERHPPVALASGVMRSLGKLSWNGYFDFLREVDVMISLQQTPHPSHPPLDAVASGGWAVTNDFEGSRAGLSPRLLVAPDNPDELGRRIVEALSRSRAGGDPTQLDRAFVESLGSDLDSVVDVVLKSRS